MLDRDLRLQLLRAMVKDRAFLKGCYQDLDPKIFVEKEEAVVAECAIKFCQKYDGEPIGGLVRSYVDGVLQKEVVSSEDKKKTRALLDFILGGKMDLVSIKALEDIVKQLKRSSFYSAAVDEIITLQDKGKLTADSFQEIVEKANRQLNTAPVIASRYLEEIAKRNARRKIVVKYPLLLIKELDEKIKGIGRGHTAVWLAPFSSGKGLALIHIGIAYAMQGLKVWHITLEDPKDLVEDRYDASITGIGLSKLYRLPKTTRIKFKKQLKHIRGDIRITDGTGEDWTLSRIEREWYRMAQEGWTPDAIIIDYDEYIKCEKEFRGDNVKRAESDYIYQRMTKVAAKLKVIIWSAAQGTRGAEGKRVVTGKDTAEDISKMRKVFLAIGIGTDPNTDGLKYLYVCRHRLDRSRFGVEIMSDFNRAIFYDRELTREFYRTKNRTPKKAA